MFEPLSSNLLLGFIGLCLLATTITMILTARELRSTLRELKKVLPSADRALLEAGQTLHHLRAVSARANRVSEQVEELAHQVCGGAEEAFEHFRRWKEKAQALWGGRVLNGTGAGPRSYHRSRSRGRKRRVVE